MLSRQIGSAVQDVSSSSAELQTTATQQATGAREQATAMSEITTTINELLATSRQIAESAQRVASISSETASAAAAGDKTVQRAHDSVAGIKKQVDLIVNHMLDLGRKSQQIGGIVDIINELAEQTNILAINATIEAAGAGDNGRRFAVVADEIRKLADRVGGSTKDIRTLIEEIRAAVNSTVMATEGGSKAVDAGTRAFGEVTNSLQPDHRDAGHHDGSGARDRAEHQAADHGRRAGQRGGHQRRAGQQGSRSEHGPGVANRVPAGDPVARSQPADPVAGKRCKLMSKDPYRYFRVEAKEIVEQLSRGVLDLEQGVIRERTRRADAASGAHPEGRSACRKAS